jgi:transcription termination factor NusB
MYCQIIYTKMSDRIVIEERIDLIKELSTIFNGINH